MTEPRPESSRLPLALTLFVGVCLAGTLAAVALLLGRAASAVSDAGGAYGIASDAADAAAHSLDDAGIAFPERDLEDPLLGDRTIVVTEGMNERTARTVARKLLFLNARDPARPIELYLSTSGGWFDAAFTIVATMHGITAPVNVTAIGGCHSAGTIVLASATGRRRAAPDALISVHADIDDDDGGEFGAGARERARVDAVYQARAHLPRDWFPLQADTEYFLTPEEALRYGLIDEILPAERRAPQGGEKP